VPARFIRRRLRKGECDDEFTSPPLSLAKRTDFTAVQNSQSLSDGQAQAKSTLLSIKLLLALNKAVEDPR